MPRFFLGVLLGASFAYTAPAFGQSVYFEECALPGGYSCATALADTDGDGVEDFFLGIRGVVARVYSGATRSPRYDLFALDPNFDPDQGYSVASLGDVNGDGLGDFALGAPYPSLNTPFPPSPVRIYSGWDGALLLTIPNPPQEARFGGRLAGLGDVNGDGIPDLAINSTTHVGTLGGIQGAVYCHSGANGVLLWLAEGPEIQSQFGTWISRMDDLDGDGVDELLVGAKHTDGAWVDAGQVQVLSGATGQKLLTIEGTADRQNLGDMVGPIGDVDLDGIPDIGASGLELLSSGDHRHLLHAYSGATGALLWSFAGSQAPGQTQIVDRMPFAPIGDADRDGVPDLAVGDSAFGTTGPSVGRVVVVSGADQSLLSDVRSLSPGPGFGHLVVPAGDPNRDGEQDFLSLRYASFPRCLTLASRLRFVGQVACTSTPNSLGKNGLLRVAGSEVAKDERLQLLVSDVPDQALTVLLAGTNSLATPMPGNHAGVLCLGGNIYRYYRLVGVAAGGEFSAFLPFQPSTPNLPALIVGQTWYFQAWHSDGPGGGNFTNSVEVVLQ